MAIKQPLAVKTVTGTTPLRLEAKPGNAFLIKDLHVYNPSDNYITLKIDKTTVGFFRTGGPLGNHLPFLKRKGQISAGLTLKPYTISTVTYGQIRNAAGTLVDLALAAEDIGSSEFTAYRLTVPEPLGTPEETVLGLLRRLGKFTGYPVAEGETFLLETTQGADTILQVEYEIHTPDDINPTDPNGSQATTYTFMNYGTTGATIAAAGSTLYDVSTSPDEFPAFPFGKVVPAKMNAKIHAIFASDVTVYGSAATAYTRTAYLKLVKDRETLFDEDRNGLPLFGALEPFVAGLTLIGEGFSLIHNNSDVDFEQPLIFDTPLEYTQGDELNIYLTTQTGTAAANLTTDLQEIGLWIEISRAE